MTTNPAVPDSQRRRRRLRPAAPLALLAGASVLLFAAVAIRAEPPPREPPRGRPLAPAALAPERSRDSGGRRLVDVVDREAARPRRIRIPAIGVAAAVAPLRRNPDGTMQTPRDFAAAGWYAPGPEPGEAGPAVIAGHVDSTEGPAVFFRLRELRRGDVVAVTRTDGSVVRFTVKGLERWPKAAFPTRRVFGRTRTAALRLVTCSGDFDSSTGHYVDNTIVYAARRPAVVRSRPRTAREEQP